jgi:3-oxoadipate enol-lactonase
MRRAHVCGVSMGGMIAQEIALGWPERVGALVLSSTYAAPSNAIRTLAEDGRRQFSDPFLAMKRLIELTFSPEFVSSEGAGAIMQLFARGSPDGLNLAGLLAQAAATLEHDTRARLRAVRAPTLVVTGDCDRFVPPELSDELAGLIPGARLQRIPGGSHGVSFERPEAWNRIVLDFLAAHDGILAARASGRRAKLSA